VFDVFNRTPEQINTSANESDSAAAKFGDAKICSCVAPRRVWTYSILLCIERPDIEIFDAVFAIKVM
jgi:hypothetical protein